VKEIAPLSPFRCRHSNKKNNKAMKLFQEISTINYEFENADEQTQSAEAFDAKMSQLNVDPIKTLQTISLFAGAIIAVLKVVKFFTSDKADKKIDNLIVTLQLLTLIK